MTPGAAPYADGDFVGQPIEQPPQAPPIELNLSKGAAALRRSAREAKEPCPGIGMLAMLAEHPSVEGRVLTCCPICEQIVASEGFRTPAHDRPARTVVSQSGLPPHIARHAADLAAQVSEALPDGVTVEWDEAPRG